MDDEPKFMAVLIPIFPNDIHRNFESDLEELIRRYRNKMTTNEQMEMDRSWKRMLYKNGSGVNSKVNEELQKVVRRLNSPEKAVRFRTPIEENIHTPPLDDVRVDGD